mgnify:CR=1 FL=1
MKFSTLAGQIGGGTQTLSGANTFTGGTIDIAYGGAITGIVDRVDVESGPRRDRPTAVWRRSG